jgi:hypothetical protein
LFSGLGLAKDAHLVEHRQNILNLLGTDLLRRHDRIELLVGDVAAPRGLLDHLRDGGVGERSIRGRTLLVCASTASSLSSFNRCARAGDGKNGDRITEPANTK